MEKMRIFFFGLVLLLLLMLSPGEMLAAPYVQVESDQVIQVVLVLDVSGSMGTPVYTGIVSEDLLSLLLRLDEIQNTSEFIRLEDLVQQAADDPDVLAADQAWSDAFDAMDDFVTGEYGASISDVIRDVRNVLVSFGCESYLDQAMATAGNADQIDFYLDTVCPEGTITPELRQAINDLIPYIDDPDYQTLRGAWEDAFRAYDEALEAAGYTSAQQQLEDYKASSKYDEFQDEIDRLVELYNIPTRLELAKAAAVNLIDFSRLDKANTDRDSLFGLVTFSNQAMYQHALTLEHEAVKTLIQAMSPQEQTNIGDALNMGLDELMSNADPEQPMLVILLSDGHANVGMSSAEILAAIPPRANSLDVTICTAGFADLEVEVDFVLLEGLAAQTDGEYLFTNSGAELGSFFVACREAVAGKELAGQITGVVDAGDVSEVGSVDIQNNTCELNLALNFLTGTPLIELVDPEGTQVEISHEGVFYQTGDNVQLLSIHNPIAGEWVINIANDDTHGTVATFSILISTSQCEGPAPIEVQVAPDAGLPFLLTEAGMPYVTGGVILIVVVFTGVAFYVILQRGRGAG